PPYDRPVRVDPHQAGQRLPVGVPELLPRHRPPQRARDHPSHHRPAWRVQPHHRVGAAPDQVADGGAVAVDDPAASCGQLVDAAAELLDRQRSPARLPVDRIELDERHGEPLRRIRPAVVSPEPALPTAGTFRALPGALAATGGRPRGTLPAGNDLHRRPLSPPPSCRALSGPPRSGPSPTSPAAWSRRRASGSRPRPAATAA